MAVRARDIMTRALVSVTPDAPLEQARRLLVEHRFSALPVVEGRDRLVGIVTTVDLLRAGSTGSAATTVGAVMTHDPVSCGGDADVRVVAHRLRHGALRAMPIVDEGVLVGIVTRADLLRSQTRGGPVGRLLRRTGRVEPDGAEPAWDDEPRAGSRAADVMTPRADTVAVHEDTPASDAAALLVENRYTSLPVVDEHEHVVGVLSEVDLVPESLSGRRVPRARTVGEAMTTGAIAVRDDVELHAIARAMVEQRFRLLPVVDHDDRLAGVVSRGDLLRALSAPTTPGGSHVPNLPGPSTL